MKKNRKTSRKSSFIIWRIRNGTTKRQNIRSSNKREKVLNSSEKKRYQKSVKSSTSKNLNNGFKIKIRKKKRQQRSMRRRRHNSRNRILLGIRWFLIHGSRNTIAKCEWRKKWIFVNRFIKWDKQKMKKNQENEKKMKKNEELV